MNSFWKSSSVPGELGGILDRRADEPPPHLEPGLAFRIARLLELWVAEQDGEERGQDFGAIVLRPSDRIRVLERSVLWVGPVDVETDSQAARGEVAARADVVAGEEVDGRRGRADHLAHAELAVGVVRSGAALLDVRAADLHAARDVVPEDVRHAVQEIAHQRLAPLLLVGRPRRRRWPQSSDRHDQHDERRGLAAATSPGGDEERWPIRQQRALDQRERGSNDDALTGVISGDVA